MWRRALLVKGAAVDMKKEDGMTALWSWDGAWRRCGCCEKGAAVDAKGKDGATALMLACQGGHVEAARLLLEKGAAVDAKSKEHGAAHARLPERARGGGAAAAREGRGGGREGQEGRRRS